MILYKYLITNKLRFSIDKSIIFMVLLQWVIRFRFVEIGIIAQMNKNTKTPIQFALATLQGKGWTLAALADELNQKVNTLEKWKAGDRNPANELAVLTVLETLEKRKRIPKKRRYSAGSRGSK